MKKRLEAFEVKTFDPTFSIIMNIMPHRYDATNYTFLPIELEAVDSYIAAKKENEGIKYNYMHVIIAALVRTLAKRNHLNRFTMNARLYERYKITVAFTIKQVLRDDADEITIKHDFNGNETLDQIRLILDEVIKNNLTESGASNGTQEKANSVASLPMGLSKALVGYLRWSDRRNMMPKSFLKISPFHTSFWITNLKSIKTDTIVHHCYDFGTTSLFIAMGKEKMEAVVDENGEIVKRKIMQIGVSADERICDGLYFGKSLQQFRRLIMHPEDLEVEYHDDKVDAEIEKDRLAAEKLAKKQEKNQKKVAE